MHAVRIGASVTGTLALAKQVPRAVQLDLELGEPCPTGIVETVALPAEGTLLGDERTDVVANLVVLGCVAHWSCLSSAPRSPVLDDEPASSTLVGRRQPG